MTTRIAKFIADCGVASRRDAERMIADGRVSVNGMQIDTPVFFVSDTDTVCIDGREINTKQDTVVYAFHKPLNTMTTTRDPMGRKTIYDVLPSEYRSLKYVGRLDYKTTGLLLLTNDGELARKLTLPSSKLERVYIATVGGQCGKNLDSARLGTTVDGVHYAPMRIDILSPGQLRVCITEGKKNEVRIVLRSCGCPVRKLHRISYGQISLGKLPVGKIKKISQKTIDEMIKSL